MREISFITKGHRLKGDTIRVRINEFLDAVPDVEKACEMIRQEQITVWKQTGKRGDVFLHQWGNPPYQILGRADVDGKTRKRKSVTLTDEDFYRLKVLAAVSGFSLSRLVRLSIARGKLVMREPIKFNQTGNYQIRQDPRWHDPP